MTSSFLGKAGEYAVAAQLLSRGIVVHFPAVDNGVDLIAGTRLRIQVKSRRKSSSRETGYNFTLGAKRETGSKLASMMRAKTMAELFPNIDYLICWGVDDNRFWILPSAMLAEYPKVQSLLLGSNHKRYADYDRILEMHKSGMRNVDIADELGVHAVTVSEVIRGRISNVSPSTMLSVDADAFEGKWDFLAADVRLVDGVDFNVEVPSEV